MHHVTSSSSHSSERS